MCDRTWEERLCEILEKPKKIRTRIDTSRNVFRTPKILDLSQSVPNLKKSYKKCYEQRQSMPILSSKHKYMKRQYGFTNIHDYCDISTAQQEPYQIIGVEYVDFLDLVPEIPTECLSCDI